MEAVPVELHQCTTVAEALAQAFQDDPACSYVFTERNARLRKMRWIFQRWLPVVIARGGAYTTPDFAGAALWHTPDVGASVKLWTLIRAGFLRAAFLLNPAEQMRGLHLHFDAESRMARHVNGPHWVLDTLGVAPQHHRKGVARALLTPVLRQADVEHIPCFVLTHSSVNASIYARFGFETLHESSLRGTAVTVYALRRLPQGV